MSGDSCAIELDGVNEVEVVVVNSPSTFDPTGLKIDLTGAINERIHAREKNGWSLEDVKTEYVHDMKSNPKLVVILIFWQPSINKVKDDE